MLNDNSVHMKQIVDKWDTGYLAQKIYDRSIWTSVMSLLQNNPPVRKKVYSQHTEGIRSLHRLAVPDKETSISCRFGK